MQIAGPQNARDAKHPQKNILGGSRPSTAKEKKSSPQRKKNWLRNRTTGARTKRQRRYDRRSSNWKWKKKFFEKKNEKERLRQQVLTRQAEIARLRGENPTTTGEHVATALPPNEKSTLFTARQMRKDMAGENSVLPTPLDALLETSMPDDPVQRTSSLWFTGQTTTQPRTQQPLEKSSSHTAQMFLQPSRTGQGEKPLLIVDFVDNLIPQEEEQTLGTQGQAKIVVSYGPKKPKLESISVHQWVIANTRIFYTLLSANKLNNSETQNYLAYTVKIMELAPKYDWKSILTYDNEFRKLQAMYGHSWNFESNHLNTVLLTPITKTQPLKSQSNNTNKLFSNVTSDSKIICRNFNSAKGCTFPACSFAHVCNRKIAGKACGQSHAGHAHVITHTNHSNTHA